MLENIKTTLWVIGMVVGGTILANLFIIIIPIMAIFYVVSFVIKEIAIIYANFFLPIDKPNQT